MHKCKTYDYDAVMNATQMHFIDIHSNTCFSSCKIFQAYRKVQSTKNSRKVKKKTRKLLEINKFFSFLL